MRCTFILPFLYIRYSFVFFLPLLFIENISEGINAFIICWFIYAVFIAFIMGNCGVMEYWTKLIQHITGTKYEISDSYKNNYIAFNSVWSYKKLLVKGKEYKLEIAIMGGNLYDEEDNLRRKAIVYWMLT